jgi:hypothetical protein
MEHHKMPLTDSAIMALADIDPEEIYLEAVSISFNENLPVQTMLQMIERFKVSVLVGNTLVREAMLSQLDFSMDTAATRTLNDIDHRMYAKDWPPRIIVEDVSGLPLLIVPDTGLDMQVAAYSRGAFVVEEHNASR